MTGIHFTTCVTPYDSGDDAAPLAGLPTARPVTLCLQRGGTAVAAASAAPSQAHWAFLDPESSGPLLYFTAVRIWRRE